MEERGEVGGHQAPVAAQRAEEPAREVEERDVVVAGHHQHRRGEPVQERARGLELAAPGALGEVAADHDQVGAGGGQVLEHGLHHPRVLAAEVQVGDVGDGPHRWLASGARTRKARGRLR